MILTLMGQEPDAYDHVSDRPGHDMRYAIDATKLREELGWEPQHSSVDEVISTAWKWHKGHPHGYCG